MNDPEIAYLYRILSQNDDLNIVATTSTEMTREEANRTALQDIIAPDGTYHPFVVQPIATAHGWKYGHINFCPRCGEHIAEDIGDSREMATDQQEFDCPKCNATMYVHIICTPEETEAQDESEDSNTE